MERTVCFRSRAIDHFRLFRLLRCLKALLFIFAGSSGIRSNSVKSSKNSCTCTKLIAATEVGVVADTENFCWPEVKEDSYPNRLLR